VVENEVVVVQVLDRRGPLRRLSLRISCHRQIDTDQLRETSVPAVRDSSAETVRSLEA
jgi:hypothetical protein